MDAGAEGNPCLTAPAAGRPEFRAQLHEITRCMAYPDIEELRRVEEGELVFDWLNHAELRRHRRSGYWHWVDRRPRERCRWENGAVLEDAPALPPVVFPPTGVDPALCWAERLAAGARVAFARELAVVLGRVFPREVIIRIHLEVFWGEGRGGQPPHN